MTGAELVRFRRVLAERLGWTFAEADSAQLGQVLERRADRTQHSRRAYLDRLAAAEWSAELTELVAELTITETYFFRHAEQFRALAEVALPERIAQRTGQRALRLLSVGCSSGEEAYTLAIVAHGRIPDPGWALSVLGLDANPEMLTRAQAATYSGWSLRETPDEIRERWFRPQNGAYELDPRIARLVQFRRYNVADDDPVLFAPGQYDVVFCRNLLMYLTPDAATDLIRRMTEALAPGGFLFLGHTDSLGSRPAGLEPLHSHQTFYYRRTVPAAAAPPPRPAPPPAPGAAAPPPPVHDRALALLREERFGAALAVFEGGLAAEPAPDDRLLYGVLLAQAGRFADAALQGRRLLEHNGLSADAHHLLGVCLEDEAGAAAAVEQYQLAAYLDPAFALPRLRLGLLARRRGEHRAAFADLERALHLLRQETDERILLFGGGFGRLALTNLCRAELDASGVHR